MQNIKRININSRTVIARFNPVLFQGELSEVEKLADTIGVSNKVVSYYITKSPQSSLIDVVFKVCG
jgi:hypothetical protein